MEKTETAAPKSASLEKWFLDLLACPMCEGQPPLHLNAAQDALICQPGKHSFPIRDGIPALLASEATLLEPANASVS